MASIANVSMGMNWADLLKRRSTLKQAFKVSKLLILASCLVLLLLTVLLLINNFLEIGTSVSKLQNAVQNAVLRVEADSDDNQEKPNYRLIITRNKPFGDLKVKQVEEEPAPVEKPVSNVPLNLIGTFMTTGEAPYAIIEDKKKNEQEVFMLNDSIFETATLSGIFPNYVEIQRGGQTEVLRLDDSPDESSSSGGEEAAGDVVSVDEDEVNKALDNLPLLLTQARAVPYFKDGKSIGLRLFAIKQGSLYEKIGLKNGDILKSINDNSLGDITQAVKLFEKLREERSINLTLERNRADKVIRYEIQ